MSTLTIAQVHAAQSSDIAATTAVVEATESRIAQLAEKAARRMAPTGGDRYMDYRDEFSQVGRITVWESLSRFNGDTVDSFMAFMYATVEDALKDATRSERNGAAGADADAIKVFGAMVSMADGDVFLAEKLSQTVPPKGRRLGADRANAARLAWQGSESIDAPRPAVGEGEQSPGSYAESLESTYGVPGDLVTSEDITREERRVKCAVVNAVLDTMGQGQADVLRHSFGIAEYECFGYGREENRDEELAAHLGTVVKLIQKNRDKGFISFAKRYIKTVAKDEAHAAELTEAAAAQRVR
ncbi:hypothetical protein NJL88_09010 [Streptomyces sp. DK15]|uniref:hypothetical protein n=1 Tax=Streptomyces sp. DK15 TaxID=2957499 RepID=UPI0029AE9DDE|nr:hypothetical protein [Streptomyces sp. DK15]MDX2390203.1 hypothetical protein [Streptomyces sp. DK15]